MKPKRDRGAEAEFKTITIIKENIIMKKNNSGFSLVELIVVIAIMAVLVGVLAPAYLKYVEKSRKSTDVSAIADIMTAASTVAADVEYDVPAQATFIITGASQKATISMTGTASAIDGWADVASLKNNEYTFKSKEFKAACDTSATLKGVVQNNGSVVWTYQNAGVWKAMVDYSTKDFGGKFSGTHTA